MSDLLFSTSERKDAEMSVALATSAIVRLRARRSVRSAGPTIAEALSGLGALGSLATSSVAPFLATSSPAAAHGGATYRHVHMALGHLIADSVDLHLDKSARGDESRDEKCRVGGIHVLEELAVGARGRAPVAVRSQVDARANDVVTLDPQLRRRGEGRLQRGPRLQVGVTGMQRAAVRIERRGAADRD